MEAPCHSEAPRNAIGGAAVPVLPASKFSSGATLDLGPRSVEDGVQGNDDLYSNASVVRFARGIARAGAPGRGPKSPLFASRTEVWSGQTRSTGGDPETPVENASVYFKYIEEHKIKKNKTMELNVKTNREGVAHVPDAPLGRVLVQVLAEGWKTYGRWFDITDPKQTIKVHLERPPKWY
jgi:hypothetical protein